MGLANMEWKDIVVYNPPALVFVLGSAMVFSYHSGGTIAK